MASFPDQEPGEHSPEGEGASYEAWTFYESLFADDQLALEPGRILQPPPGRQPPAVSMANAVRDPRARQEQGSARIHQPPHGTARPRPRRRKRRRRKSNTIALLAVGISGLCAALLLGILLAKIQEEPFPEPSHDPVSTAVPEDPAGTPRPGTLEAVLAEALVTPHSSESPSPQDAVLGPMPSPHGATNQVSTMLDPMRTPGQMALAMGSPTPKSARATATQRVPTATPKRPTLTARPATSTPKPPTMTPKRATATPRKATATPKKPTATAKPVTATPGRPTVTPRAPTGIPTKSPLVPTRPPASATATPPQATPSPQPSRTAKPTARPTRVPTAPIPTKTPLIVMGPERVSTRSVEIVSSGAQQEQENQKEVNRLLERYRRALELGDIKTIRKIWPSLRRQEAKQLERTIEALFVTKVQLSVLELDLQEAAGTVRFKVTIEGMELASGEQKATVQVVDAELKKQKGDWVLD